MPIWLRILLGLFVGFLLLLGIVGFVGYRWLDRNKEQLQAKGEETIAEGKAFGEGKPANACVDEALARLTRCDGFLCEVQTQLFLQNCLPAAASVPPELCKGVPKRDEPFAFGKWAVAECERRGAKDVQACSRVLGNLREFCDPPPSR